MMIHEITAIVGQHKPRKRIGRGRGSGHGKTSGRGTKGDGARTGHKRRLAFEGGQMPYFRRIPKRGFTNAPFKTSFWIVNLCDIVAHPNFAKGGEVNPQRLVDAGLIRDAVRPLKVLGDLGESGKLSVKLQITAERVTDSVRKVVVGAGGTVNELGTRRDTIRGVERNSEDRAPKNLGKKLKRGKKKKSKAKAAPAEAAPASE